MRNFSASASPLPPVRARGNLVNRQLRPGLLVLLASSLLFPGSVGAQVSDTTEAKAPWQWTTSERLQKRLAPEEVLQRKLAVAPEGPVPDGGYTINGRHDPELFLPWELFNHLVAIAFSGDTISQQIFRVVIERNLAPVEVPPDFWEELEIQASEYIDSITRQRQRAHGMVNSTAPQARAILEELAKLQAADCQRRLRALRTAEKHFGRDYLYQVLYQRVAPETTIVVPSLHGEDYRLRFVQGGCDA